MGRGCLFQALFISIVLVLGLSDFLFFEKGNITPHVLTNCPSGGERPSVFSGHSLQEKNF